MCVGITERVMEHVRAEAEEHACTRACSLLLLLCSCCCALMAGKCARALNTPVCSAQLLECVLDPTVCVFLPISSVCAMLRRSLSEHVALACAQVLSFVNIQGLVTIVAFILFIGSHPQMPLARSSSAVS